MVVKIQKSLVFIGCPTVLIYDKDRTFQIEIETTKSLAALFKKDESKIFHQAEIINTKLRIGKRVRFRNW